MADFPRLPASYNLADDLASPPQLTSIELALPSSLRWSTRLVFRAALGISLATYAAEETFEFGVAEGGLVRGAMGDGQTVARLLDELGSIATGSEEEKEEHRVVLDEEVDTVQVDRRAPLHLVTRQSTGAVAVDLLTSPLVLSSLSATRFLSHLRTAFLSILSATPETLISTLSLLGPDELAELDRLAHSGLPVDAYPDCHALGSIILRAASATPDADALVFDSLVLSFSQLVALSTAFAHHLQHLPDSNERTGGVVPLCLHKSPHQLIALLGVVLSGSAYLNFEPSLPAERKASILRDLRRDGGDEMWTGVAVVDHDEVEEWDSWRDESDGGDRLLRHLVDPAAFLQPLLDALPQLPSPPSTPLPTPPSTAPAYVIFTSGSTGTPKGIVVEHRNVVAFLRNYRGVFGRVEGDRVLGFPSYGFDVMVVNIWDTWAHSAAVALTSPSTLFSSLPSAILDLGITIVDLTPTVSSLLFEYPDALPVGDETIEAAWRRAGFKIKQVNTGGEKVEGWVRDRWAERGVKVVIDYGPSETTVGVISNVAPSLNLTPIPIGRPTGRNVIQLLAPSSLVPVPRGCTGEICVAGEQVSRGYLKQELNTGVFVGSREERIYRTGDWGRWTEEGMVEFLGRRDGMVKVNGLRIEIGEIESRLDRRTYPDLRRGVVDRLEKSGTAPGLVAFLVFHDGSPFSLSTRPPLPTDDPTILPCTHSPDFAAAVDAIKGSLRASLPTYMVPRYFLPVSHIPTQGMGKADRKRLRYLADAFDFRSRSKSRERKRDQWHDDVRQAWAQVLRLDAAEIGDDDIFTHLGGDSIGFLKVVSVLRGKGYGLRFADLEESQPLSACAQVVRQAGPARPRGKEEEIYSAFSLLGAGRKAAVLDALQGTYALNPADVEDVYPTAPSQDAILAASIDSTHYYAQAVYNISPEPDLGRLQDALAALVNQHPALRTVFAVLDGEETTLQVVLARSNAMVDRAKAVHVVDCDGDGEAELQAWLHKDRANHTFEWCRLSLAFAVFIAGDRSRRLVWSMHHAMSDGWTLELLVTDIRALCFGLPLTPRPSFATFTAWWASRPDIPANTVQFWQVYLAAAKPLQWPATDALDGELLCTSSSSTLSWRGSLRNLGRTHGLTPAIASRVAIAIAVAHAAASADVIIGVVRSGRDIDVDGCTEIVGPCVSVLPSRLQVPSSWSLLDVATEEARADRQSRSHQGVTLSNLARLCSIEARSDLFNILVTFQSLAERDSDDELLAPWPIRQPPAAIWMPTNYALSFEVTPNRVDGDELEFSCFYDHRVVSAAEVDKTLATVASVMDVLTLAPRTLIGDLHLESATRVSLPPAPRRSTKSDLPLPPPQILAGLLEVLAPIWATVLSLDPTEVQPDDTFSSVGGDSIAMMRLSVTLKRHAMDIPPGTLANLPTMLAQASWLYHVGKSR